MSATRISANELLELAGRYIAVDGYYSQQSTLHLRGTVSDGDTSWQAPLKSELYVRGYGLSVRQKDGVAYLTLYPDQKRIPWLNIVLFIITLVSVSFVPAFLTGGTKVFEDLSIILHWQRFAIPLMSILLVHELGHYLAARRRGIRTSLPYFLPAPNIIGTFGAFIKSRAPFPNRNDLLAVGAYGPLAGFVVAFIFLVIGMWNITYRFTPPELHIGHLVEPLVMRILSPLLTSGNMVPEEYSVYFQDNLILFAAWVGLVVTMLNLLPVGQLDGGHIIYAMFPRRHRLISRFVFLGLLGCGFIWPGWWMWALLLLLVIRFGHPPTLNDFVPLDRKQRRIGWIALLIFCLTFTPIPF